MKKSLKHQLFQAVGVDVEKQSVKLTQAPTIHKKDKGTFAVPKAFAMIQADLIYMPEDENGYKYILSVVDIASRHFDAVPLKGRLALDVIQGFNDIWKHKYIDRSKVQILHTDPGSEFKNEEFTEYINQFGISLRHSMTARKNQTGVIERYNHLITRTLGTKMTSEGIESNERNTDWAESLPKIVKILNESDNIKTPNLAEFFNPVRATKNEIDNRMQVGSVVHVRLQQPKDYLTNEKLVGTFRNGDIRWERACTEISNVLLLPNQPIRYMVKKYNNVSFMRKEILLASPSDAATYREKNPKEETKPQMPETLPDTGPRTRAMTKRATV